MTCLALTFYLIDLCNGKCAVHMRYCNNLLWNYTLVWKLQDFVTSSLRSTLAKLTASLFSCYTSYTHTVSIGNQKKTFFRNKKFDWKKIYAYCVDVSKQFRKEIQFSEVKFVILFANGVSCYRHRQPPSPYFISIIE